MKIDSKDYHDYVIKGGVLVREFEQMYQNSTDVPWHQDEQADWLDVRLSVELLREQGRFARIIDYGCGLGYYLNLVKSGLKIGADCYGFDISKTAVLKAKNLFPEYCFQEASLTLQNNEQLVTPKDSSNSLHIIRGTLWYVYPEIGVVVSNLVRQLAPQDTLLVIQNFPPLDGEFAGKEVIPDHNALIDHFTSGGTQCERYLWYEQQNQNGNDSWFLGIFKKYE